MCNYRFEESKPVIQTSYTYEENGVLYCTSATQKGVYWYVYALNNPLKYKDPTGQWYEDVDYEWNFNITTGDVTKVGDKGGEEKQYINIVDDNGRFYEQYVFDGNNFDINWAIDALGKANILIEHWERGAMSGDGMSFGMTHFSRDYMTSPSNFDATYDVPLIERGDTYTVAPYRSPSPGTITPLPSIIVDAVGMGKVVKGLFTAARIIGGRTAGGAARAGTYSVYQGLDAASKSGYVGITSRAPTVRFTEHLSSNTARSDLFYRTIDGATGLTRTQARIWEQNLINQHGLGNLLNLRNSIDPKYWWMYGIKP